MRKISIKSAQELIKDLLQDVEVVDGDGDAIELKDLSAEISAKVLDSHKPGIEQELRAALTTKIAGEIGDKELKAIAKTFGITDKKVLEGLKHEDALAKAKELHAQSLKLDVNEWNAQREQMVTAHQTEKEAWEADKNKAVSDWETKYNQRDLSAHVLSQLEKLPRTKGGDLTEQAAAYLDYTNRNGLQAKYNSDKKRLDYYKDNALHVEDGKTIEDAKHLKEWAKKTGILMEDNRNTPPAAPGTPNQPYTAPTKAGTDPYAAIKVWSGADAPATA